MACRVQKRISLRRKLHILRALIYSNSAKKSFIGKSTILLQLYKLKAMLGTVKREYDNLIALTREYQNLVKHIQAHKDVKVEKVAEGTFVVRVSCEKGGDKLVAILEAFEEMGLDVAQARVSCDDAFSMEAIVAAEEDRPTNTRIVAETILKAIGKKSDGSDS